MKKIPTIFKREFYEIDGNKVVRVLPEINDGLEEVLLKGVATEKWDGSCCAIINGVFYRRYDAKRGKSIPEGAIKCQEEADPITGHFPCWIPCNRENPADKWFWDAYDRTIGATEGTYEAVGRHFRSNPYNRSNDILIPHGKDVITVGRTFDAIKEYLEKREIEGIVFWLNGEPRAKIKRSDFGFKWGR